MPVFTLKRGRLQNGLRRNRIFLAGVGRNDMPITTLDERTALVLIDFQEGTLRLPIVHPRAALLARAAQLVESFRSREWPVVFVHVNAIHQTRTEQPPPSLDFPPDYDQFTSELPPMAGDTIVTKHSWDAFYGTDLDMMLRRKRVTGIVFAGLAASRGVESSARSAHVRGYNLTFARDAITDIDLASYDHSVRTIYPRLGEVDTTEAIVGVMQSELQARP